MGHIELLAPAGDFERLQFALNYGADAVYIGGTAYSLRANAKNFDMDEIKKAADYTHNLGKKIYVGVNIFAHNEDLTHMSEYLHNLKDIGVDAVIVADPGVFNIARKIQGLEIHISTQANITNYESARFFIELGASRIILARELDFDEIRKISKDFNTEVFVHGAMCMSYSGRCLLSNLITHRDANKGNCSQPCRWEYDIRPNNGPLLKIYEDERGTYILNSKDLCMIEYIPELMQSGVKSLKIEGRMKTVYYTAVVTRAYRKAIDDYSNNIYEPQKYLYELKKTSHRDFSTGFYFGKPEQNINTTAYNAYYDFIGVVKSYDKNTGVALVEQRNKFSIGDKLEFVKAEFSQTINELCNIKHEQIQSAPHAQELLYIKTDKPVEEFEILRKKSDL